MSGMSAGKNEVTPHPTCLTPCEASNTLIHNCSITAENEALRGEVEIAQVAPAARPPRLKIAENEPRMVEIGTFRTSCRK